jgi:hypothetical protein
VGFATKINYNFTNGFSINTIRITESIKENNILSFGVCLVWSWPCIYGVGHTSSQLHAGTVKLLPAMTPNGVEFLVPPPTSF